MNRPNADRHELQRQDLAGNAVDFCLLNLETQTHCILKSCMHAHDMPPAALSKSLRLSKPGTTVKT